ncbi:hypothetical protein [Galbitalea soli]|uniref:Uncharacterized protein n=1 Tax=Galbitalea soli TaxID=1268042 RepID=A0A7C9PMM3_9MICO|nr:hypothetical protein [Galbitalea soli]NEM90848.1 hypothetical protein [Galbitalea soli]
MASTDAEVLAAATNAYTGFVMIEDRLLQNSREPAGSLMAWATPQFGASEQRELQKARNAGEHLVGRLYVSGFDLLSRKNVAGAVRAKLFACADATHSQYLDSNGRNARNPKSALRVAVEVDLRQLVVGASPLLVNGVDGVARVGRC